MNEWVAGGSRKWGSAALYAWAAMLFACSTVHSEAVGPSLDQGASSAAGDEGFSEEDVELPALTPLTAEQSCAATVVQAEAIEVVTEVPVQETVVLPSVYYLMLDSSGSMARDLSDPLEQILDALGVGQRPPTPLKWQYALDGLTSFVRDPRSVGIELGLGYFPGSGECDGSGYDVPSVALGQLPGNTPAIEASLAARAPAGGTPLEGALRGVTDYCLALNARRPEVGCVAVLVTDGAADAECGAQTALELASISASAAQRGVPTYVAGMGGADLAVLDAIGEAGGGDCNQDAPGFACDLTANPAAFVTALSGIRDRTRTRTRVQQRIDRITQVVPCEWEIPEPSLAERLDPARVNVQVSDGSEAHTLENVSLERNCGVEGGWFYDDPLAPTRIRSCSSTCEFLRAQPEAEVRLLFGCATVVR